MSERADARKRREEAEEYPKAGWRGETLTGPTVSQELLAAEVPVSIFDEIRCDMQALAHMADAAADRALLMRAELAELRAIHDAWGDAKNELDHVVLWQRIGAQLDRLASS